MYLKCGSWPEISDVEFNLHLDHLILGVDVLGVCEVFLCVLGMRE